MSKYVLKQKEITDEQQLAKAAFKPGLKLYGFCQGRFGRDSYYDKTIVEVKEDSVVVKDEDGVLHESYHIDDWVELLEASNSSLEDRY